MSNVRAQLFASGPLQVPLMCTALVKEFDSLHSVCVLQVGSSSPVSLHLPPPPPPCLRAALLPWDQLGVRRTADARLQCCVCVLSLFGLKYGIAFSSVDKL